MKTTHGIFTVLAILLLNACNQNLNTKVEESEVSSFEVIAIHDLEVQPEIDFNEFETFVMNEIAPIYNKMQGQKFYLVKGDRGVRTNKYTVILTFDSLEDRNRIYPPTGEFVGDFGSDATWDKFNSMLINGIGKYHTDYVVVNH